MTEHTQHTELIDSYLSGGMSAAEETSFMELMETDPILKEEFLFQKSIVGGLREYRRNELKNRLSSISVGVGVVGFLMNAGSYKLMAAALTIGVLGYGTYFAVSEYFEDSEDKQSLYITVQDPVLLKADHPVITDDFLPPSNVMEDLYIAVAEETSEEEASIENVQSVTPQSVNPVGFQEVSAPDLTLVAEQEEEITIPEFTVPDFSEDPSEEEPIGKGIDLTNIDNIGITATEEEKKIEIEQVRKNNKAIQYKFTDGKLYLYGDFGGEPYELLEINSSGKKTLYFYHNKFYYRLNRFQKSVSDVIRIDDKKLVKELEIIRTSR